MSRLLRALQARLALGRSHESSPVDPQLWLVIALPLILLAANGSWLWDTPRYYDPYAYLGFFKHYLEFKLPYAANYKSSRLPFVLPGILLYRLLPGAIAHHLLHLGFLTIEAVVVYAMVRRRFGSAAAYVSTAALVTSTFSHTLSSYHNQASAAYFILAVFALEWPARSRWQARLARAGAVYAMALTTNSILVLLGPFLVVHALVALPRPLRLKDILIAGVLAVAGGAAALALVGLLNVALGGPFLFFMEQVNYSADVAKFLVWSRVSLSQLPVEIFQLPMLALPAVIGLTSLGKLVWCLWHRRFGRVAIETGGYVMSLAFAAVGQARGMAVLDNLALFQVFNVPMYLALGALLCGYNPIGWRFAVLVAALFVAPLALGGSLTSQLLLRIGPAWPAAVAGVPFVFMLAALGIGVAWSQRYRGQGPAIVIAAALGLANLLCTEFTQPANLYQLGAECRFRAETFQAALEVDKVISEFDPNNEAQWASPGVAIEEPAFDGHDFCHRFSPEAAARAAWLVHYFYTSKEMVFGARPRPLKKFTLVATSPAQLQEMVAGLRAGLPPGHTLRESVVRMFSHSLFNIVVGGYDVVQPS